MGEDDVNVRFSYVLPDGTYQIVEETTMSEIKFSENIRMTISERLALHKKWFLKETGGVKLEEHGTDLRKGDLCRANLRRADLSGADLSGADLSGADLSGANLYEANLCGADLYRANLRGADLSDADLRGVHLYEADLSGANLYEANLYKANLSKANLYKTSFGDAPFMSLQCPEEGAFIAWKKCGLYIVKLQITENSKRSSATSRQCRCSEALVLDIQNIDGSPSGLDNIASSYDENFIYRVGEVARVDDFDENRWNECSSGIHFFITRGEAVNYEV